MTKTEKAAYDRERYRTKREILLAQSRSYHQNRRIQDSEYRERKRKYDQKWKQTPFGKQWSAAYTMSRKQRESGSISADQRLYVFQLFNHQCIRCESDEHLEIDHFKPLSRGFAISIQNAIVLCRTCNRQKYNKMPEDFFTSEEMDRIDAIQNKKL